MTFWDKVAGIYDIAERLNGKVYSEMLSITERMVPEYAMVLDTASGTGMLSVAACKKAEMVVCTDLSLPMLKQAKINARKRGYDNIVFEARDIYCLPDEDETYDVTIAGNVLHLLDEPYKALDELYRVTKKGGKILLPTFMTGGGNHLTDIYKLIGFNPKKEYTPESYREMLLQYGVGDVRVKLIHGLIPCCYAVIRK